MLRVSQLLWEPTGSPERPWASSQRGRRLEIALGDFPVEPTYTLLVDGVEVERFDDWPAAWFKTDSIPLALAGAPLWGLRGVEVQPGLFTSADAAAGRVTDLAAQGTGMLARIEGERSGQLYVELPAGLALPFRCGDPISIRQRDSVAGIHPKRDLVVFGAAGELLACQVESGDHAFAPGWKIAVVVDADARAAVHLSRGTTGAVLRGSPHRLTIDGERWIVAGEAHVIRPGRPVMPDERDSWSVWMVRDLG